MPPKPLKTSEDDKLGNEDQHDTEMQKQLHNFTTNHPKHVKHAQSGIRKGGPADRQVIEWID